MGVAQQTDKTLTTLLTYISTLVVKDEILFEQTETYESRKNFNIIHNYFYDEFYNYSLSQQKNFENFKSSPMYLDYTELNSYIVYLQEILLLHSVDMTYLEIRFAEPFEILYYDKNVISLSLHTKFSEELVQEYEYQSLNFLPDSYKDEEMFTSMFRFSLMISTVLRVLKEISDSRITLETTDIHLLDNFILSYGFVLNGILRDSVKARFALSLHRMFRTKGSYNNIREINNVFNFGNIEIYNLYLVFDETRWIEQGSPNDKTNLYYFLAVNELEGETFSKIFNDPQTRVDRFKEFDYIVDLDNSWKATENELYDAGIVYSKSKYFFVADSRTIRLMTDGMSLMSNIARRLEATGRSDDFKFSVEPLNDTDLFTILKYFMFASNKVTNAEFDYLMGVSDTLRENVFTGFNSEAEFNIFVDGILNEDDLMEKFNTILTAIGILKDAPQFYRFNTESPNMIPMNSGETRMDLVDNQYCDIGAISSNNFDYCLSGIDGYDQLKDSDIYPDIRLMYNEAVDMNSQILTLFGVVHLDNKGAFYETIDFFKTFYSKMLFENNSYRFKEYLIAKYDGDIKGSIQGIPRFNEQNILECVGSYTDNPDNQTLKYSNDPNISNYVLYREFCLKNLTGKGVIVDAGISLVNGINIKPESEVHVDDSYRNGTNHINAAKMLYRYTEDNYVANYSDNPDDFIMYYIDDEKVISNEVLEIEHNPR